MPEFVNLDLGSDAIKKILGLVWNINTDKLSFKPETKIFPGIKQGILSMISTINDPLGILTTALLKPKKIIQHLWKKKIDWDKAIPHQLLTESNAWKYDLENITKISLNRWFGFHKENGNDIELHVFCDTSTSFVAYLKCIGIDKNKPVFSFVMSKSRLAPMKEATLTEPRLKLQADVLAVHLKLAILDQLEFPVSTLRLWSDSQIIIKYIRNASKRFLVFVMNRLHEIRLNSTITEWNYFPRSENPVGMCTRHTPLQQLHQESLWINGPSLLYQNQIETSENETYN